MTTVTFTNLLSVHASLKLCLNPHESCFSTWSTHGIGYIKCLQKTLERLLWPMSWTKLAKDLTTYTSVVVNKSVCRMSV